MNNLTQTHISFPSTIDKKFQITIEKECYYLNLYSFKIENITYFISKIKNDQIYLIFPFITTTKHMGDPYLRLSNNFLVTNKSNTNLISEFLKHQWDNCDFEIKSNKDALLHIKYRRVSITPIFNTKILIYLITRNYHVVII